ncbi:helix-turn-helix domain-containing protein [Agrobacterium sp. 16-172Ci]
MNVSDIVEKIAQMPERRTDAPTPPPVEVVAFVVRWSRNLKNWKISTLADFAGVSISTVERVERGETVSEEALDRIAVALGYEKGAFHTPRMPLGPEKAFESLVQAYGHLQEVAVSPMKTQRAIREAAKCDGVLLHRPDVPQMYDDDIANLAEYLDLASFVLGDWIENSFDEEPRRRKLYNDILDHIKGMERRGLTVLCGIIPAPQPKLPTWKIAIVSITPKLTDPGAIKRSYVYVDKRNVDLPMASEP